MVTFGLLLLLILAALAAAFLLDALYEARHRGEVADGPDYYDTDPPEVSLPMREAREALSCVLVDVAQTNRRLELIADANPDLVALPKRLEGLYVIEVDS